MWSAIISERFPFFVLQRIGPSYRSGPGFCPTINATDDGSEILVAAGAKKSIKVGFRQIKYTLERPILKKIMEKF